MSAPPRRPWWTGPFESVSTRRPVVWLMSKTLRFLDVPVFRLTNGRVHLGSGYRFLLLTTTGARTGRVRETPLFYVEHGEDVAVIGSNFGADRQPAWSYNLHAKPECRVTIDRITQEAVARLATENESRDVWDAAVRSYSGFGKYPDWIRGRTPPVFIITQTLS